MLFRNISCNCLFFISLLLIPGLQAQSLHLYPDYKGAAVLNDNGGILQNPCAGGLLNPQFSNIDLNGDGLQDLFIFEPVDGKVLTFLNLGNSYRYAPEYEQTFPAMQNFALLADYNKDGKADIFTYHIGQGSGLDIYENVSAGGQLRFKLVRSLLLYQDVAYKLNLYVASTDIPVIADIDGDGYLDILALDVFQSQVCYYRNVSSEKFGNPDSLAFQIYDRCWGKFTKSSTDFSIELGVSCGKVHKHQKKHGGSTMMALDIDGDGDMDILMGDPQYPQLYLLINGRKEKGFPLDTMIAVKTVFPEQSRQASVPNFATAFSVKIGYDDLPGLLVSPQSKFGSATTHQILYYRNTGSLAKPVFTFVQDNFLQDQMLDNGQHAAPVLWDFDGDGLTDMVLATQGNPDDVYAYDKLVLYKNVGGVQQAVFKKIDDDWLGLSAQKVAYLMPCFADLDGDGLADMLLGREDGKIMRFKNAGITGGKPVMQWMADSIPGISANTYSAPFLADLDRDGLPDLLVGKGDGTISWYRNTGTKNSPVLTLMADTFGHVHTYSIYYTYDYDGSGHIIDSVERHDGGNAAPVVADLDGDGKWDLVTGAARGRISFYFNIEDSLNKTFNAAKNILYNAVTNLPDNPSFGWLSAPAVGPVDSGGKNAVLIGNYRGGINYYSGRRVVYNSVLQAVHSFTFRVFPNPSSGIFTIKSEEAFSKIEIWNILGEKIYSCRLNAARIDVDLAQAGKGIYFLRLTDRDGFTATGKLVIE